MKSCNNDVAAVVIATLLLLMLPGLNAWEMLVVLVCGTGALFATSKGSELRRGLVLVLIACMAAAAAVALIAVRFH